MKWLYIKSMGFFGLVNVLLELYKHFKNGGQLIVILLLLCGGGYFAYGEFKVQKKILVKEIVKNHAQSNSKISQNKMQIELLKQQNGVVLTTLKNINNSIITLRTSVQRNDQRVWQFINAVKKSNN